MIETEAIQVDSQRKINKFYPQIIKTNVVSSRSCFSDPASYPKGQSIVSLQGCWAYGLKQKMLKLFQNVTKIVYKHNTVSNIFSIASYCIYVGFFLCFQLKRLLCSVLKK